MKPTPVLFIAAVLAACAANPPRNPADLCAIFREKTDWYAGAKQAQRRWGVPIPVQLAIINRESSFVEDARPPRYRLFGFIPLWHLSSAYGYGQVKDDTWDWYQARTHNDDADRDEFADVVDFIGWYVHQSHTQLGIAKHDAYRQYLAYHEGQGGYKRGTHANKVWLLKVARKVAADAGRYQRQLAGCRVGLERDLVEQ
ncbi:hypothetical protein SAMN02949497_1518 [Methylomagnum ishizawai]|uniref:Transglycosylase SLT domain-containing protein n=1 Tax=Methylomagnum ishizawai TaxID=1760988 RepID=A0A1Y6CU77_9GAMM|nr:hypothetical protein [Methylomagnum ishizawai]SMF94209.1 hypothetical protein SAMN02949497_1518 [Methylomagnum ishizawai]